MKKHSVTIMIILFLLFVFTNYSCAITENTQTEPADTALAYSNKASARFMKFDIEGAIECLNEAIRISPRNPQLYLNRGFVKHVIRDYKGAMQDYNEALNINPKFAFAYNNRGVLKVSMNDISGAMEDYATALSINGNYSDVYYNRGNLKYMTDDLKGALDDYDKAIELNPKDSEAYNNRGVVKKRLNYNVGALSDYSQAIAINPKGSIAYANRGRLKKLYFDNEGAAIDLDQAVALAENQAFIKNVKPLLSNQHYIAAIPALKSFETDVIAKNTKSIDSLASVGTSYKREKSKAEPKKQTEDNYERMALLTTPAVEKSVVEDKPIQKIKEPKKATPAKDVKTVSKSGTATFSAGVGKVASPEVPDIRTTAVTKNATTNVKLAESYYIRGLQKCVLKDLQGAIVDLDKAIANNSKYADAYFYRGAIKKELGDKEGFRQDYSTAIQLKPSLQTYNDSDALSLIQ